ncbi:MAG: hypothetical protein K0S00_3785 [Xanthobacteraceae bacterium]|jgi:hypothetical protein|nr:hypothetical protein [Xanthobacteraceae bacterium]
MNKIILAAVALATLGSVAAQAADGRDQSLFNQPAQAQLVEGRNAAVALPTTKDAYIKATVEQNARSSR